MRIFRTVVASLSLLWAALSPAGATDLVIPGAPSPYVGQVATRSYMPQEFYNTNNQMMSRVTMFARSNINSLQLVIPNFYVNTSTGVETGSGAIASTTACIEYPTGTFIRVKFSGSNTGSVPNGGYLISDPTAVAIPYGAKFFARIWWSSTGGVIITQLSSASSFMSSDAMVFGTTTPDLTCGGTVTTSVAYFGFFPAAVIGQTTRPAVCLYGDSRTLGYGDTADSYGDTGEFARAIGPSLAYINLGVYADEVNWFVTSTNAANRLALAAYCSHATVGYGINDISNSASAAAVEANIATLIGKLPAGMLSWVATLPPETTSTDSWATTANQTAVGTNSVRVTFNAAVRAGSISGARGYIDEAGVVESGFNSGLWCAPGCTADGVHETQQSSVHEQASSIVPAWNFGR